MDAAPLGNDRRELLRLREVLQEREQEGTKELTETTAAASDSSRMLHALEESVKSSSLTAA
jgi:hypothetical protein